MILWGFQSKGLMLIKISIYIKSYILNVGVCELLTLQRYTLF